MESKHRVNVIGVEYACDDCHEGVMLPTGEILQLTQPPKHGHKCNACGADKFLTILYPTIRFERIEEVAP